MKLSDVMSAADLSVYAEIAMVIFMAAFVAIVIHVFRPSRKDAFERHGTIPFSDEGGERPHTGGRR